MNKEKRQQVLTVAQGFSFDGNLLEVKEYGNGHINDTYLLTYEIGKMGILNVILQKMNRIVFPKPEEVMENIQGVTEFLKKKISKAGGNPYRETLTIIPTKEGAAFYKDAEGEYWRSFVYITDTSCYELPEDEEVFYQCAYAFGNFQNMLADYPAESLHETIANFHNTKERFKTFQKAVKEDVMGRAALVSDEIDFVLKREKDAAFFTDMLEAGKLPLRVTHNDTKLNNIMVDNVTGKGLCVIDLDTVMPGLAMNDFGDSIRSGASTGAEDEKDLQKVSCDMGLFEVYAKGFIEGCGGRLTPQEIELLPMGAKIMTYECGMRFLTDYLQGDVYFKIHRPEHNLDRCRTQFKLVADMEEKWQIMQDIVRKYQG